MTDEKKKQESLHQSLSIHLQKSLESALSLSASIEVYIQSEREREIGMAYRETG